MHKIWLIGWAGAILIASPSGCSSQPSPQSIVVLAAASLEPTFTEIGELFEKDNPGAAVRFDFASSVDLAIQLTQGASGDVFASADMAQMDTVSRAGLTASTPVNFGSNLLVIVTAPGNPKHVGSFADLARPGLTVVTSPPPMPCGVATQRIEDSTGVHLKPVSEEPKAVDVLNKVTTGEADAGVVDISDALAVGSKVSIIEFPEAASAVMTYPIAVLQRTTNPDLARRFVAFVTGAQSQGILQRAGFTKV